MLVSEATEVYSHPKLPWEQLMRKVVITLSLIGSGLIILDSIDIGQALTMFMLGGVVPGTSIILSSTEMLIIYALLIGFILSRLWYFAFTKMSQFIRSQKA